MKQARSGASVSLLPGGQIVVCGGWDGDVFLTSCESWRPGQEEWTEFAELEIGRGWHVAWTPAERPSTILLMGGYGDDVEKTVESVPGRDNGPTFSLRASGLGSCAVAVDDNQAVALIGGGEYSSPHRSVDKYNVDGFVRSYPDLLEPRSFRACASFGNEGGLIVAGGWDGDFDVTDSVEILDRSSATSWRSGPRLPRRLSNLAGSNVDGVFTVAGGWDNGNNTRSEVSVLFCLFVCWRPDVIFIDLSSHCIDDFNLF